MTAVSAVYLWVLCLFYFFAEFAGEGVVFLVFIGAAAFYFFVSPDKYDEDCTSVSI